MQGLNLASHCTGSQGAAVWGTKEGNRAPEARTGPQISTHRQANEEGAGGGFGEGYEAFQC